MNILLVKEFDKFPVSYVRILSFLQVTQCSVGVTSLTVTMCHGVRVVQERSAGWSPLSHLQTELRSPSLHQYHQYHGFQEWQACHQVRSFIV